MKTVLTLFAGIIIGLVIALLGSHLASNTPQQSLIERFHNGAGALDSQIENSASPLLSALQTMNSETALCDQPYFAELYDLNVAYFASKADNIDAVEFADVIFDHARQSGHFSPQEAEAWIEHIELIPGQLVEIIEEDPTVLENCYNWQVAAVGPPA